MRRYGSRAGSNGIKEDPTRCIIEVRGNDAWDHGHQCKNKRSMGEGGLFCGLHKHTRIDSMWVPKDNEE